MDWTIFILGFFTGLLFQSIIQVFADKEKFNQAKKEAKEITDFYIKK